MTHSNPSSCLGAERASRNSNTGDRAHGGFGAAQSAYIRAGDYPNGEASYGTFLQNWMSNCAYAPGSMTDDDDDDSGD